MPTHRQDAPHPRPDDAAREAAALVHPSRRRLVAELAERPEGMTAAELAERLGLHPNAVRRHLAALAVVGIVSSTRGRAPGKVGRPAIRHRLSSLDSVAAEGHRELVRLLLRLVRSAGTGERRVEEVGREEGRMLGRSDGGVEELLRVFARFGFAPDDVTRGEESRRGEREIRLRHCPFKEAVLAPGGHLVCALHRGLTLGVLDHVAEDANLSAFEPKDPRAAGCRLALRGLARDG